jgi:hypothetical protein
MDGPRQKGASSGQHPAASLVDGWQLSCLAGGWALEAGRSFGWLLAAGRSFGWLLEAGGWQPASVRQVQ